MASNTQEWKVSNNTHDIERQRNRIAQLEASLREMNHLFNDRLSELEKKLQKQADIITQMSHDAVGE